jgi:RNA-directed DNA polymerase
MLNLRSVSQLAEALGTSSRRLCRVADTASQFVKEKSVASRKNPGCFRTVISVSGPLRSLQVGIQKKLLLPRHRPSVHSHGGIKGRSIKTNCLPHVDSVYVFTTDISKCYPSIHHDTVYKLFLNDFSCAPGVARMLTKLCTYDYHLALGLITSPILADCILKKVDRRIGAMCTRNALVYTRFVDDITISGLYNIESGSAAKIVEEVLGCYGFNTNKKKQISGRFSKKQVKDDELKGIVVTGLRVKRGRLDVERNYIHKVRRQIHDALLLARGEEPRGDYFTPSEILGRIRYINWVNPGQRVTLMRKFRSVDWKATEAEAVKRGLLLLPPPREFIPMKNAKAWEPGTPPW